MRTLLILVGRNFRLHNETRGQGFPADTRSTAVIGIEPVIVFGAVSLEIAVFYLPIFAIPTQASWNHIHLFFFL